MRLFKIAYLCTAGWFFGSACGGVSGNAGVSGGASSDSSGSSTGGGQSAGTGSGGATTGTQVCGEMALQSSSVPPNLMLVVDLSMSMTGPTSSAQGAAIKVDATREALLMLIDSAAQKIRFGWMPYPGGSSCEPGAVVVDCAADSSTAVRDKAAALSAFTTGRSTPTGQTLEKALEAQTLHDATRSNFVLLLTDGMPTCPMGLGTEAETVTLQAIQALRAASIDTFVVGLGEDFNSSNPDFLNQMAEAGGRPRANNTTKYYPANSVADLMAVLQDIGGAVMGCTLTLSPVPDTPDYLWVNFDGQSVARDRNRQEGFDYDPAKNQLLFFGNACEQLKKGSVKVVEIKMGCSPPT